MLQKLKVIVSQGFIEECRDLLVEGEFAARWTLIQTYHTLGLMLLEESKNQPKANFIATVAVKVNRSERTLWYAIAFAEKFPKLDKLPEGKLISWRGVIVKYLTSGSDEPHEHDWIPYLCCSCGARKKQDDPKKV